jgi:hypothetical protein
MPLERAREYERAGTAKTAIIPVGMHFVLGYNNINVGAAAGYDLITGPNKDAWAYRGELWTGVGLDIVK